MTGIRGTTLFAAPFQARQGASESSVGPSTMRFFKWGLRSALTGLLVVILAGCLPFARNKTPKMSLPESSERKTDSAPLPGSSQIKAKGNSSVEQNASGQTSRGKESGPSDETQWPTLRQAASSLDHNPPSKLKSKADPAEVRKVHAMAWDLIKKNQDVKAVKICHAPKNDEWWITLYKDAGGAYEPEPYVWNALEEELQPHLVVMRKIPHSKLKTSLSSSESGRICEAFEPTTGGPVQEKILEKISPQPVEAEPKERPATNARLSSSDAVAQKSSKPTPPVQREQPIPAPAKKIALNPSVPSNRAIPSKDESLSSATVIPESRKQVHADPKLVSPFKKTAAEDSDNRDLKETKSIPAVKNYNSQNAKPTYHIFVYGSSMNHSELMNWLDENGYDESQIVDAAPSKLEGYDFVWNYFSPSRGGGTVNLEAKPSSHVYGLLLEIEDGLLKAFDSKEGHPKYYLAERPEGACKKIGGRKNCFCLALCRCP